MQKNVLKENLLLALPLIVAQIGHVVTGMVDNIFLGQIGLEEQDAGILSNNIFVLILVFAIGVSQGLTPIVSEAFVTGSFKRLPSLFKNALFINLIIGLALAVLLFFIPSGLHLLNQPKDVEELANPFMKVLALSMLPLSVFFTCKQFTEGLSNTRFSMIVSIVGNLLNIVLNYGLIYGKWGMPELGYMGSCWATFWARLFMALMFLGVILIDSKMGISLRNMFMTPIRKKFFWPAFKLGIGPAFQYVFEVAAFNIAGIMAGWIGKEALDAHGISLSMAAFSYMFGSGLSGSTSVLISNYKSSNEKQKLQEAFRSGFILVFLFMGSMGLLFLIFRNQLPIMFTDNVFVLTLSAELLIIAAIFQVFDGAQVIGLGVARGLGDVKIPTIITLISYWGIALPLSYLLAFKFKLQVHGIWIGLTVGLAASAIGLYWRTKYVLKKVISE